jgi:sulfhydrogenase subunit beta (sulfur reductase)
VVGIRPCDAKATLLVKLNFDTPDVKDPYWLTAYHATTFIGMACDTPLSTCFCTTAGCGPYHEEGLDVLVMDRGDAYLAKILTDKGKAFADAAGGRRRLMMQPPSKPAGRPPKAGSSPRSRLTTWPAPSFWNFTVHPSGKMWPLPASTAAPAHLSCPTCWCFDIQDEVHGNVRCAYEKLGQLHVPHFHRPYHRP